MYGRMGEWQGPQEARRAKIHIYFLFFPVQNGSRSQTLGSQEPEATESRPGMSLPRPALRQFNF